MTFTWAQELNKNSDDRAVIFYKGGDFMPKEKSVKYTLRSEIFSGEMNSNTKKTYDDAITKFSEWCDDQGMHHISQVETAGAVETVKAYCSILIDKGYSPSTIHVKLAPVCRGLGVSLAEIDNKPRRTIDTITRGRNIDANPQGRAEAVNPRYERFTSLCEAVYARKSEISRLKGRNLVRDESGYLCVEIERGKGGKHQLERIPSDKVDTVERIFSSVKPDQYVFTKAEANNKIDVHDQYRATGHRRMYDYYLDKVQADPAFRETMRSELIRRYDAENDATRPGAEQARARFVSQVENDKPYRLRGATKETAIQNNRPVVLDRTVVLYVSVFFGSHWRIDTEVKHYLIS